MLKQTITYQQLGRHCITYMCSTLYNYQEEDEPVQHGLYIEVMLDNSSCLDSVFFPLHEDILHMTRVPDSINEVMAWLDDQGAMRIDITDDNYCSLDYDWDRYNAYNNRR